MAGRTVNTRYIPCSVLVPARTLDTAPARTAFALGGLVNLSSVELVIPPGHVGLTGWRIELAGEAVVPWGLPASWIVGDDFAREFFIDTQAERLTVAAYNLDVHQHLFVARARVDDLGSSRLGSAPELIDLGALNR